MLLSEGFGWYTFQPPSSAVSTTLVGHYYSGVYTNNIDFYRYEVSFKLNKEQL